MQKVKYAEPSLNSTSPEILSSKVASSSLHYRSSTPTDLNAPRTFPVWRKVTNDNDERVDDLHQFIFSAADVEKIHCALLTGLPSNIGLKEKKGEYRGARNLKFFLFPASSQFKPAPQWVMSAEIVETRKVYARSIAAIDPLWVIAAVPHLVKHEYNEPHWDAKRGQVMAFRSTTLYGLVLASRQLIPF